MLELKDNNIKFYENCYHKEKIKGIYYKVFDGVLSYKPTCCPKCGVIFDNKIEKHGFITSNIKLPNVSGFKTILRLRKQRYLCKHCGKAFTLRDKVTQYGCFISNNTKYQIALDLTKKPSETNTSKEKVKFKKCFNSWRFLLINSFKKDPLSCPNCNSIILYYDSVFP